MAVVEEILRSEADGSISFGNHKLAKKAKVEDYEHAGDLLKVKTYNEMTKLEKNGMFLYESVPGTSVLEFKESDNSVEFIVEGDEDSQITVGLKDDTEYEVFIDGKNHEDRTWRQAEPECRTGSSRGSTCEDRRGVKAHCKGVQTRRIL